MAMGTAIYKDAVDTIMVHHEIGLACGSDVPHGTVMNRLRAYVLRHL
jgi:hypothetical protein